jgi:threonine/homoserine/homoserine lactone efflux protein
MELIFQLLSIFLLGLIGGANPGPILASSFTEALRKDFAGSFKVILRALIAETVVAAIILFAFFAFKISPIVFSIISIVGSIVLVWLAVQIWKIRRLDEKGEIFSLQKIFMITIFSGPFWIFWITICVPQAFLLSQKIVGGQIIFLILFEIGWFISTTALVFLFSRFRSLLTKTNFIPIVFKIMSLILLFFAVKLLLESYTIILK